MGGQLKQRQTPSSARECFLKQWARCASKGVTTKLWETPARLCCMAPNRSLCKAVATTSVRQERNAPIYLFIGDVLLVQMRWARTSHCSVKENHLPIITGQHKNEEKDQRWWLSPPEQPRMAHMGVTQSWLCTWGALRPLSQDWLAKDPAGPGVTHKNQADSVFLSNTPCLVSFDVLKVSPQVGRKQTCSIGTSNFIEQEHNHS